jgi:hypothetical protein
MQLRNSIKAEIKPLSKHELRQLNALQVKHMLGRRLRRNEERMKKASIVDISFDEEDIQLLNQTGDLLLKAKSIKYSILPKLNVILESALSAIRTIYGIEVFSECSIIHSWPSFREKRENKLELDYESAFIGITGARRPIWKGFYRDDGKEMKIIPYRFGFMFSNEGLSLRFYSTYANLKMSPQSYRMLFNFINENIPLITSILSSSNMQYDYVINDEMDFQYIKPLDKIIKSAIENKDFYLDFFRDITVPISNIQIQDAINSFVIFYPIYDMVIRFGLKLPNRIFELYQLLTYDSMMPLNTISNDIMKNSVEKKIDDEILKQKYLDNKNIARAGIRWQVFERDDFKCVACGASAQDGAILHVDHIIPRSKGGEDIMENYQTLCHLCNIGKSNKSNKNLRKGEKSDP